MSMNLYLVLYPASFIAYLAFLFLPFTTRHFYQYSLGTSPRSFMEIKEIDWPWKFTIIGFAGIHFIVASILETWFFPPLARLLSQHLKKKLKRQKKPYKVLAMDMKRIPLAQVETA